MSRLSSPSVQITEFSDQMNPHPVAHGNHTAEEGLDVDEKEGVISASKLVSWCCWLWLQEGVHQGSGGGRSIK